VIGKSRATDNSAIFLVKGYRFSRTIWKERRSILLPLECIMSIAVACECGQRMKVPDALAGKQILCEGCRADNMVRLWDVKTGTAKSTCGD
jgi:hypothetical protein